MAWCSRRQHSAAGRRWSCSGEATSSHLRSRRRVNSSLTALFADLAERFGHMTADGILIDLPLTHEILGGLVAARRSTVSLALQHVASTGVITRLDGDLWKLDRSILAA